MATEVYKINLKQDILLRILVEHGVSYAPSFDQLPQLDTGYTLTLDAGLATEQIYTVGSGLTLSSATNSVIWNLDTSQLQAKTYTGTLESDSKVSGMYLKINLIVEVE